MNRRSSRLAFHRRLRQLGFGSYDQYLRASHWTDVKQRFRGDDRDQDCYCCGEWEGTQLHHRSYERLGEELLDDLVPLCKRCHALVHVLERRGDLALDLAGLLDEARAARYREQQRGIQERVAADRDFESEIRRLARSFSARLKAAVRFEDSEAVEALCPVLDEIARLIEMQAA